VAKEGRKEGRKKKKKKEREKNNQDLYTGREWRQHT